MYDLAELEWANDAIWSAVRQHLAEGPAALTRNDDIEATWRNPGLVLGQACGYPLVRELAGTVAVVGSLVPSGHRHARYRSMLVCRRSDPVTQAATRRERTEALSSRQSVINGLNSLSGHVSLVAALRRSGLNARDTPSPLITGSHAESIGAVVAGLADIASIDAVTWRLLRRHRPGSTDGLEVWGRGPLVPTLPLITAGDPVPLRTALARALSDPTTEAARSALAVAGFAALNLGDYDSVRRLVDLLADDLWPPDTS